MKLTEDYAATQRELVAKVVEVTSTFLEVKKLLSGRCVEFL